MEVTLQAEVRKELGKGPAHRIRAGGKVPAVLYGSSVDPVPVAVDAKEMTHALHTEAGSNVLINLQVDGSKYLTIPREIQKHPIRGSLIHIDFLNVARDVEIEATVPVHLTGESYGVKEGGQIDQPMHEIRVQALPTRVPPAIEVDISGLGIGDSIKVADLPPADGVTLLNDPEDLVVAVTQATVMEVEPEEAAAEPEAEAPAGGGAEATEPEAGE